MAWNFADQIHALTGFDADSTSDSDRFMALSEGNLTVSAGSAGNVSGDYFLANNTYQYKISLIYDGYQEGPLSDATWNFSDTMTRSQYHITIRLKECSKRLSGVCVYRRDNAQSFYSLVKQISTQSGWGHNAQTNVWSYILSDNGDLLATYESRTGLSEVLDTIKLKYGLSSRTAAQLQKRHLFKCLG